MLRAFSFKKGCGPVRIGSSARAGEAPWTPSRKTTSADVANVPNVDGKVNRVGIACGRELRDRA
jgi:hypothetical protein